MPAAAPSPRRVVAAALVALLAMALVGGAVHASPLGRLYWELSTPGAMRTPAEASVLPWTAAYGIAATLLALLLARLGTVRPLPALGTGALFGLALSLPTHLILTSTWAIGVGYIAMDTGWRVAEGALAALAATLVLRRR